MPAEIAGWGTPESTWQSWGGLDTLRRLPASVVAEVGQRVVVVAPHPDDELLGAGGVLAQLSPYSPVLVVAVTDGEASHPESQMWTPERLSAVRPGETERALAALGVPAEVTRLGLPDGGVAEHEAALVEALGAIIEKQDVVLTTWSGDGHPDHEAVGRAVTAVCTASGAQRWAVPIWMWHWARPGDDRVPWSAAVRFDLPDGIAIGKREAVERYESQLAHDPVLDLGCILPEQVLARLLRSFEVMFREG